MRPWIKYTLVRVIIFAVILAVLLLVGVPTILAAVIAALGGLGISFLFFRKLRDEVALEMANRRKTPAPRKDDEEEDALDENQRAE